MLSTSKPPPDAPGWAVRKEGIYKHCMNLSYIKKGQSSIQNLRISCPTLEWFCPHCILYFPLEVVSFPSYLFFIPTVNTLDSTRHLSGVRTYSPHAPLKWHAYV